MFLFNIQTKERTIRFERDIVTNKVTVDKIAFIKTIRDAMHSGLRDSKDFCDLMLTELNKMSTSPDLVRMQIRHELDELTTSEDLVDILRFVRSVKDHQPFNGMGNFSENGNYNPAL